MENTAKWPDVKDGVALHLEFVANGGGHRPLLNKVGQRIDGDKYTKLSPEVHDDLWIVKNRP